MPAASLGSLLITPDRRRRLQQQFELAQRLAAAERPDIRRVHELLAEVVGDDPGSVLYLRALLANLRRREGARKRSWLSWLFSSRGANNGASVLALEPMDLAEANPLLRKAPDRLWRRPTDAKLYARLATAAGQLDLEQVELEYAKAAVELAPADKEMRRILAQTQTWQGRFEDALETWSLLLAMDANNVESIQAVRDL
jgi:tetratricopeptide (TPR) repeat protein